MNNFSTSDIRTDEKIVAISTVDHDKESKVLVA
jgi:hypothetical protein